MLCRLSSGIRETQRKNDLSRVKAAIDSYKSNNRGQLPWSDDRYDERSEVSDFGRQYLKSDDNNFQDPDGLNYRFTYNYPTLVSGGNIGKYEYYRSVGMSIIFLTKGVKCDARGTRTEVFGGSHNYAIQIALEGGGSYCLYG